MRILYTLSIYIYVTIIRVAALFNHKARLWVNGRKNIFSRLKAKLKTDAHQGYRIIWIHCSSLGEFEQGRPVIEKMKKTFPRFRILLTFFSPSGYEIRKNYDLADWVFYLPPDTPVNARKFVHLVNPIIVFFVKYDYWFNYLHELKSKNIPVLVISAVFRPGQYFFQWYGEWFRKQLNAITWFFVQNEISYSLLKSIGSHNASITGDTRFDRVADIAAVKKEFPFVKEFCGKQNVFIAGSTWKEDEDILIPLILDKSARVKFIIAPHDTSDGRIKELTRRINKPIVRYSDLTAENSITADILLIDTVGILAHLYQYARVAYIGGGFGAGIHNIQEPITFGVPVFFGPRYHKFREATDLISQGAAFSVKTTAEMTGPVSKLISDQEYYTKLSVICRNYVEMNKGSTEKTLDVIINLGLFPAGQENNSKPDPFRSDNNT